MKIAAAVVTYNRKELLRETIEGLLGQKNAKVDQIFITENASTDGTKELLKSYVEKYPDRIVAIWNEENTGGACGFFQAIEKAHASGADWIWIMDDDAEPVADSLSILLAQDQIGAADTGAVGCFVVNEKDEPYYPNLQCKINFETFQFEPVVLGDDKPKQVNTNSFVGMLLSKKALDEVGMPNKDFFIWYDDIEFSMRLSKKFKIWMIPNSKIIHKAKFKSFEKGLPVFSKKMLPNFEWNDRWRMYYASRNYYYLLRTHCTDDRTRVSRTLKHLVKDIAAPLVFKQDRKFSRIRLSLEALVDGLSQNLGKRNFSK